MAEIADGHRIRSAVMLEFHVKGGGGAVAAEAGRHRAASSSGHGTVEGGSGELRQVAVQLPARGSLVPLFRAFDLVGEGEGWTENEGDESSTSTMQVSVRISVDRGLGWHPMGSFR